MKKLISFERHLSNKLKDKRFKEIYDEEKYLLELGLSISDKRKELGLTQKELAEMSHVTQQQLSKIEHGLNCNLLTFIKITSTLGIGIKMQDA
jgi:DNA-binding XRE family transcriptional regulator